jgi:hypothetical protein
LEAGPKGPLPFTPSNVSLDGMDLSQIGDEDVTGNCEVRTAEGDSQNCFWKALDTTVVQSDQSKLRVFVVKSLKVEPTGHLWFHGGLPVAIVSLGDVNVMGQLDGHAFNETPGPGGFRAQGQQKGSGPCGGAASLGTTGTAGAGAGGGSSCGVGGQGTIEIGAAVQAGPKTPACGTQNLIPLVGGSSGGGGDIGGGGGGGAIQIVAGGTFTLAASAWINVGGGGGDNGGLATGQESGGGGAGGAVLVEASTVKITGTIAANGGGGGGGGAGANVGGDGTPDGNVAKGGPGMVVGGDGSGPAAIDGMSAPAESTASTASSGGGGAGRIRINIPNGGSADLSGTFSPALTSTCATQGAVK